MTFYDALDKIRKSTTLAAYRPHMEGVVRYMDSNPAVMRLKFIDHANESHVAALMLSDEDIYSSDWQISVKVD